VALKTEAIGLGVMVELPLVIVNVQRGGPSTGLPTKTEQADLLQALYGRNGAAPVPIVAAATPGDCFYAVFEGARLALKYMTPVMVLTDGYLGNGSEPWMIPQMKDLPDIAPSFHTDAKTFLPYKRDEKTLSRPWAIPGTPGLEHRIGGLEKAHETGNVSYDPANHEKMVRLRAEKVERIADDIPLAEVEGDEKGDLLVVGWGGTYGAIRSAVTIARKKGLSVSHLHIRHVHPLPKNVGEILYNFKHVLVPEINLGQLIKVLRDKYLVPAVGLNKVRGLPFKSTEIEQKIEDMLKGGA
jgi:2-oxoglutarate ferredoxin oxidoreductase subunit alpha